ncbi:MAG: hypothetical protein WD187_03755 [Candidatus Woykebacteria bacterium]
MKKILTAATSLGFLLSSAAPALAAEFTFVGDVPFRNLGELLGNLLILIFAGAAILAFIFIVIGGLQWITAGGDKMAAQSARDRITAAVVGLVIIVAAFALTLIITTVLGVNIFEGTIVFPEPETPVF